MSLPDYDETQFLRSIHTRVENAYTYITSRKDYSREELAKELGEAITEEYLVARLLMQDDMPSLESCEEKAQTSLEAYHKWITSEREKARKGNA